MGNSTEWVKKLNEIYNDGEERFEVKTVEKNGATGFYLFFEDYATGHLLCSDNTVAAFYEIEISDVDPEPFHELFRREAMDNYGFEEEVPDLLTWKDVKEYVSKLSDERLNETFLATSDGAEFGATYINLGTNSITLRSC